MPSLCLCTLVNGMLTPNLRCPGNSGGLTMGVGGKVLYLARPLPYLPLLHPLFHTWSQRL